MPTSASLRAIKKLPVWFYIIFIKFTQCNNAHNVYEQKNFTIYTGIIKWLFFIIFDNKLQLTVYSLTVY